jgi:hypothetical protein
MRARSARTQQIVESLTNKIHKQARKIKKVFLPEKPSEKPSSQ